MSTAFRETFNQSRSGNVVFALPEHWVFHAVDYFTYFAMQIKNSHVIGGEQNPVLHWNKGPELDGLCAVQCYNEHDRTA